MRHLRRSLLFTPADNARMLEKAGTIKSDALVFDLEDAVVPTSKAAAREVLRQAAVWKDKGKRDLLIRVNDVDTEWFLQDLDLVAELLPDAVILPKATPEAVVYADHILTAHERSLGLEMNSIRLLPVIETARGVCELKEISGAAKRVFGLQFGAEDFTRDMEIERTKSGEEIMVAKTMMAIVCKAYRIEAIDSPFTDFRDDEGLKKDCEIAKRIGIVAKTCIHPNQVEIVNEAFMPTREEIEYARGVLATAELEENRHKGAFPFMGKMIDPPIIARARHIIQKSDLIDE